MLGYNQYIFPRIFIDKIITNELCKNSTSVIHGLDWSKKEFKHHEQALSSDDNKFLTALPEPYDTEVGDFRFIFSSGYITEIQYQSRMACNERLRSKPGDTMIRDICNDPVQAHIMVAFKLLGDCVIDCGTGKYVRNRLHAKKMAYKFWRNQTGIGLVMSFSELRDEHFYIEDDSESHSFRNDLFKHEKIILDNHNHSIKYGIEVEYRKK